jgi:hypothetical protein
MNSSDQADPGPGWKIKGVIILKRNLFINKYSSVGRAFYITRMSRRCHNLPILKSYYRKKTNNLVPIKFQRFFNQVLEGPVSLLI